MLNHIVIKQLEFRGRCGVTAAERASPQPLAVDLELRPQSNPEPLADNLARTVDYAKVAQRIVEIGTSQESCLLETMGERLLAMLFEEFPIEHAKLWVRKLQPPITYVTGSVGVTVEGTRSTRHTRHTELAPAKFLVEQLHRLPPQGNVLDVAAGSGRHSLFLASHGYRVEAIDRDSAALERLSASARARAITTVTTRTVDLEHSPHGDPRLGKEAYDVIVVFFYLYRSLFPYLIDALKPGGMLVYETFTIDNYFHHQHPTRWEFCLAPNELLRLASGLQVLHYDEGGHANSKGTEVTYTAQLVAHKPTRKESPT